MALEQAPVGEQLSYSLGGYRAYAPPADLANVVETSWTYECIASETHRLVPHEGVHLACTWHKDGFDPELFFIGPRLSIDVFTPEPDTIWAAVRVHSEWSRFLLGVDPGEHIDALTPLDDVARNLAASIRDQFIASRSDGTAGQALLNAMRRRASAMRARTNVLTAHNALMSMRVSTPCSLRELSMDMGVSGRHLRRLVKESTGINPKRIERLLRLNSVLLVADQSERPSWSRLAYRFGYFDQAHLIRDYQDFCGGSPAEVHAERMREHRTHNVSAFSNTQKN